jgi:hypothetical protein
MFTKQYWTASKNSEQDSGDEGAVDATWSKTRLAVFGHVVVKSLHSVRMHIS